MDSVPKLKEVFPASINQRERLAGVSLIPGASRVLENGETRRWDDTSGLDTYLRILRRMQAHDPDTVFYPYHLGVVLGQEQLVQGIVLMIIETIYGHFGKDIQEDQKQKAYICEIWEAITKEPMSFQNIRTQIGHLIEGCRSRISYKKFTLHAPGELTKEPQNLERFEWDIRENHDLQNTIEQILAPTLGCPSTLVPFWVPRFFEVSVEVQDRFPDFQDVAILKFLARQPDGLLNNREYRYKLIGVVRLRDESIKEDQCRVYDETVRETLPVCFEGVALPPPKNWSITSTPGKYLLFYRRLGIGGLDSEENPAVMEKVEDRTDYFMLTSEFARRRASRQPPTAPKSMRQTENNYEEMEMVGRDGQGQKMAQDQGSRGYSGGQDQTALNTRYEKSHYGGGGGRGDRDYGKDHGRNNQNTGQGTGPRSQLSPAHGSDSEGSMHKSHTGDSLHESQLIGGLLKEEDLMGSPTSGNHLEGVVQSNTLEGSLQSLLQNTEVVLEKTSGRRNPTPSNYPSAGFSTSAGSLPPPSPQTGSSPRRDSVSPGRENTLDKHQEVGSGGDSTILNVVGGSSDLRLTQNTVSMTGETEVLVSSGVGMSSNMVINENQTIPRSTSQSNTLPTQKTVVVMEWELEAGDEIAEIVEESGPRQLIADDHIILEIDF